MSDLDLARRAVAAGWEWRRGCLSADGLMVYETLTDGTPLKWGDSSRYIQGRDPEWCSQRWSTKLPDFNDPATRGVLLGQVRKRWNEPQAYAMCVMGMWFMRGPVKPLYLPTVGCEGETAALIAALEAAKEKGL